MNKFNQKRHSTHAFPFPNTRPIASKQATETQENRRRKKISNFSNLSLGSEIRLKLRRLAGANLSSLAVASVGGSLAAGAGVARGLVVFVAGAAAGALAGGTLVLNILSVCVCFVVMG